MDNSIYEVTREDFISFVEQIKPECRVVEKFEEDNGDKIIKVIGQETKVHFCTEIIDKEGNQYYYIFNFPAPEERRPPIAKQKITLKTKEEVQAFMNILSKLQKGEK